MKYETTFEGKPLKRVDSSITQGKKTQATVEAKDYEFSKIPDSEHVICIYKDTVHIVLKTDKEVQCTCQYFRENPGQICEHILGLQILNEEDFEEAPKDIITLLEETEGWTINTKGLLVPPSEPVTPEVVAELPPDEVPNALTTGVEVGQDVYDAAAKKSQAKKPLCVATCQYCELEIKAATQENADKRRDNHEKVCKERPAESSKAEAPASKPHNPRQKTTKEDANKPKPTAAPPKVQAKKGNMQDQPVIIDGVQVVNEEGQEVYETPEEPQRKQHPTQTAVSTDVREMPSDAEFQQAKVGRILKNQGSIYKVRGKEMPDSAAVSNYAIAGGVSTETTILEQTKEYARATVRAYKGGRYTEGSVLIRKDAIFEKVVIDLAEKNPTWITGWSSGLPEFDLNQVVHIGDSRKILGLHIAGVVADKWMFASRDCETKAGRRAMIKILGADWREDDEIESEVDEMKTVAKR